MNWERIDDETMRAKVYGGWLVLVQNVVTHVIEGRMDNGWDWRPALAFVPDPKHEWAITQEKK